MSALDTWFWRACIAGLVALSSDAATAQFANVTMASGLGTIVEQQYQGDPEWWLSGLHFADLDGDGDLDFFLSAHGDPAVATLNNGAGVFSRASGTYPLTEIHLHYDRDGDGRLDLTMTYQDGGGQW